jgi:hypothetical protein
MEYLSIAQGSALPKKEEEENLIIVFQFHLKPKDDHKSG